MKLPGMYYFDCNKLLSIGAFCLSLLSCGPSPVDQAALFHSDKPLRKGQEIVGIGIIGISNNQGHADLSLTKLINCRDVDTIGDFDVVLDDRGKKMAAKNTGQLLRYRGSLTGESTIGLKFIPSANIKSENGSSTSERIPELVVREFHEVRASDIGCDKN
jgi:hypothetical protein